MSLLEIKKLDSFNEDQDVELNKKALVDLGGLKGLEKGLRTNFKKGLSSSNKKDLTERQEQYGRNEFPEPEAATWFDLFMESFEDTTIRVLLVAAIVSLAIGFYEDPSKGWVEGVAILSAVLIVAVVTATNNYNKELQFRKLNAVKDDVSVTVIRDGDSISINIKDLLVGDIVVLNAGDKVPADGVLVSGSDVTCNESALTGESDDKKKGEEEGDVFLLSGTALSTGYAHMVVTAVGELSRWGKTKAKLAAETNPTPLQEKLDVLAGQIGNFGMVSAGATFIAMMAIRIFYPQYTDASLNMLEYVLKAFIMAVTIVVVAVPEGLPLAVTLSLAFSTQKMMKDNNLIRVLAACETMGNATTICSDKTGTLTQNRMTVVEGWFFGKHVDKVSEVAFSKDITANTVQNNLCEGISVNSTANLISGEVVGNKTEGALLQFIQQQFKQANYVDLRQRFNPSRGDRLITFSSARKRMSVVLKDDRIRGTSSGVVYTKGASEVIVARCTHYVTLSGDIKPLDSNTRDQVLKSIDQMAKNALRTVGLAYKEIALKGDEDVDILESGLILQAVVGIKDPLRPDVIDAVRHCQEAGIFVRMVTGDNIETAKAIAKECGILTDGGIALEGPEFRKLSLAKCDEILPKLQVLARSSPDDKHTLVTRLNGNNLPKNPEEWSLVHKDANWEKDRELLLPGYEEEWSTRHPHGEVVGVTGDGTNDGPALKAADVGLSMGLSGTDVAKEASDIVILDDNFSSIVKSVMWGRAVFDNIRKFLQFQLTVNAVALTLTFISALTGREPPLNAVMMLWVNLIMDTMGALALGTEAPSTTLLRRKPYKRNASLINNKMWRNILVQFLFQMVVLVYLLEAGPTLFGVTANSHHHLTIIFNTFVFCQVFNELNARSIDDKANVFEGLHQNPLFIGIILFTAVFQVVIVEYGGDFVKTEGLTMLEWQKCIAFGALSLPIGAIMRYLPIQNSDADFAEISEVLEKARRERKPTASEKKAKVQGGENHVFSDMIYTMSMIAIVAIFVKIVVLA